jgi:hypothetical protein
MRLRILVLPGLLASTARAKDNILDGFVTGRQGCGDGGGNDVSH